MPREEPQRADSLAYERAVRSESRVLFRLAYAILRDPAEAEDVVQDTFEIAWRSWSSLREINQAPQWLKQICLRRSLRIRRGLFRRIFLAERALDEVDQRLTVSTDPDLDRAFRRLSLRQRAVISLHYVYGYELDDCAELMGCQPGTARSHLARALATLRKELKHE